MSDKKLTRSITNKVIAGVCGGLGTHFGKDPILFRVLFGISLFIGGLGLLVYIILWLITPKAVS